MMYEYGYGVDENYSKNMEWFRKAAEQGYVGAQFRCMNMERASIKIYLYAVEWYRKAAEQGYACSQYHIGVMYHCGYGVDENHSTAVEWYRKAAEQGHTEAKERLDFAVFVH